MIPLRNVVRLGALAAAIAAAVPLVLSAQEAPAPPSIQYGTLSIRGYELREARFDRPYVEHRPDGTTKEHDGGWQIAIRGADFPIRALDPILLIDDEIAIWCWERHDLPAEQELVFNVVDPTLLRSEHMLQVIYGRDERTRTKLLERLDPEKLVKLPAAERRALGLPELEGLTLDSVARSGQVRGHARLSSGTVRLAARLGNGTLQLLDTPVTIGAGGTFSVEAGALPAAATHLVALLVTDEAKLGALDLSKLPKGVELLDSKPIGSKPAGR